MSREHEGSGTRVDRLRLIVEQALADEPPRSEPRWLYEPVAYVTRSGGKRLRPVLLLLAAEAFGGSLEDALPAAVSVELFHNFTLVHDDIMDDSDERRGRPTLHAKWNSSVGILAGDYLLARSYELLSELDDNIVPEALRLFNSMVVRLCEGQALDADFETRLDVTLDEYLDMVSNKTAALIEVSLALGGLTGGASPDGRKRLEEAGRHLGIGFQIQDDLLDVIAPANWGKPPGADLMAGKRSFVVIDALRREREREEDWFTARLRNGGLAPDQIAEARERLERMGVLSHTANEMQRHYGLAQEALDSMPETVSLRDIRWLTDTMIKRRV